MRLREKQYFLWLVGLTALHSGILTPLYLIFNSDVVYQVTVLPDIFYTLSEWSGYFFHWVFLAFYLGSHKKSILNATLIGWAVHYVTLYATNLAMMGFANISLSDIVELVAQYLLDLLLLFVALLLSRWEKKKTKKWLALLPVSLFRVGSRILYDVYFGSDASQWMIMAIYYLWDVVMYVAGVLLVSYAINKGREPEPSPETDIPQ